MEKDGKIYMTPEEFSGIAGTKLDLYNLMTIDMDLLLPSFTKCPTEFMRSILSNKKKALKNSEARLFIAPKYKEIGIAKLWGYIKDTENLNQYFPDYSKGELPEREYLWTIISTVEPKVTKKLISDARSNRGTKASNDAKDFIAIEKDIYETIVHIPHQKAHRGRISQLLKGSTKFKKKKRAPKEYKADFSGFGKHQEHSGDEEEKEEPRQSPPALPAYSTPTVEMEDVSETTEGKGKRKQEYPQKKF